MTQPAKVQEPSMEEILASIRRIIADDEAKPAGPDASAKTEAAKPDASKPDIRKPELTKPDPMKALMPKTELPRPAPAAPVAKPAPAPAAASNNQDDIDALLSGFGDVASPAESAPSADADVLELTDEMALPDPPLSAAAFRKVDPQNDLEFTEVPAAPPRARQPAFDSPPYEAPAQEFAGPSPQMMSRATVSAVESAFNSLATTVLSNNARTLEDLVKEMLRPMLKSWLDDNLPNLVERIVKAEIERVSRGR